MNSNSANDTSAASAVDDTNKSSLMINNNNTTNAPADSSMKEGDGTTTEAPEPNTLTTKIVEESVSCQNVVQQDTSLSIPSQSVTSAKSTTEIDSATMIPPATDDDEHGLEPPNKRQKKTNEEIGASVVVVSNTDVSTGAAESKTATPTVPSSVSTGIKPVVNITNSHHSHASSSTTQLLLPDYAAVRQTVQDLLALLQLYGPLTANQLEYNLPPVVAASIPWSVHDVLTILVAIGLVQHVKGTTDQYCMFGGIPRAAAIYPTEIMSEIQRAIQEAEESYQRCQILQEALRYPTNTRTTTTDSSHNQTSKNYLDVLKQLRHEYPQITNDPVYWTALRNCPLDHPHHHQIGSGTNVTVERRGHAATSKTKGSSKEGGGRSTKANKGATTTAEATGHSIISTEKKGVASLSSSKVPPTTIKSTESEATQRRATSIECESSQVSDMVETMVNTTKAEPTVPEKTDADAPITNDSLLPKLVVPTLNKDTVGASTTTTTITTTAE